MIKKMRLLDVCDFQGGTQPPKNEWISEPRNGYVRMLQIRDYSQGDEKFIEYVKDTGKLHKCREDDIMLSRYGYIGQAFTGLEGAYNVALVKVIKKKEIDTKYLFYYFQSAYFQHSLLSNVGSRATIPGFNKNELENTLIPVPALDEQVQIGLVLSKLDMLISFHQAQLAKLNQFVQSRFMEMFGDPVLNPMRWPVVPLLEMGECKNGMNFHNDDSGVEINCLGVGDFKNLSKISDVTMLPKISLNCMPTEDYLLRDGDIVFVRSNGNKALVGRCLAVYPNGIATTFSGFCIRYRRTSERVCTEYLLQVLKSESMRKKMAGRGANIQNLNQQILGSLLIPVPPMMLQHKYGEFISCINKSKLTIQASLDKLELLKKSLMQQYFG